jgi:3-isopropylmalate dehydrogenase
MKGTKEMSSYKIAVMEGDGIGPEIVRETVKVLEALQQRMDKLSFQFEYLPVGLEAHQQYGSTLPSFTMEKLAECDAGILGPVTTHIYEKDNKNMVNPSGTLRKKLDLYANIRPAKSFRGVATKYDEVDLVIVRENTEGMYADRNLFFGNGEIMPDQDTVLSFRVVTRKASERVAKVAFELANSRKQLVTIVHKMNVLRNGCGLFVNSCREIGRDYENIKQSDFHVDAFALHLVQRPEQFDVIVTTNMFGDILSDLTAGLVGGLGLAPGLNLGDHFMIAQATHGSAPEIARLGLANPVAEILSAKMMLEWLGIRNQDPLAEEAASILQAAVEQVIANSVKTPDLGGSASTSEFGDAITAAILGV